MRPLSAVPFVLASLVPFHSGGPDALAGSLVGVVAGLVVVGLYLVALRWTGDEDAERWERASGNRDRRSNR